MVIYFLLIFIAIVYMILRLYLRDRWNRARVLTDEEHLTGLTQARGVSTYKIFYIAGTSWNQPENKIEEDFKFYLKSGDLPHYVRDYIRKSITSKDLSADSQLNPGGKLPPSWLA